MPVTLMFGRPLLPNHVNQTGRADPQRSGDPNDVVKRNVSLTALNLGDVVAMDTRTIRQFFLADIQLFT